MFISMYIYADLRS